MPFEEQQHTLPFEEHMPFEEQHTQPSVAQHIPFEEQQHIRPFEEHMPFEVLHTASFEELHKSLAQRMLWLLEPSGMTA